MVDGNVISKKDRIPKEKHSRWNRQTQSDSQKKKGFEKEKKNFITFNGTAWKA